MRKVKYSEFKPFEFKAEIERFPVAYLPLGTLEWHGPHMPLGADGIQSEALFLRVAEKMGGVVLPMLFLGPDRYYHDPEKDLYGMDLSMGGTLTDYHCQILPGSAYWVDDELFDSILLSIARNLARQGVKILVGHGHGPSIWHFLALRDVIKEKYGITIVNPFELIEDGLYKYQNDHAAANETSITMYVEPELVDLSILKSPEDQLAMAGRSPMEYASYEYGEEIMRQNVEALCKKLESLVG